MSPTSSTCAATSSFSSRVTAAIYDEDTRSWTITLEDGSRFSSRFLITAIGPLSTPTLPRIEGRDDFKGASFHTARWPKEPVDFAGKRVAVIGTGATGIQTIQTIAEPGRPSHRVPAHAELVPRRCTTARSTPRRRPRSRPAIPRCSPAARRPLPASCTRPTRAARSRFPTRSARPFYEKLYGERGFGIWQGNFSDILIDRKANATISDFVARKIRERVKNQAVAEKLIPKNHGFGTRRLPLETFYYEVYNQDNVELVDIKETPIERITPEGIKTSEKEYEFDIIIYATGFDAITGSFDKIDFRGAGGARLKDKWKSGPETYLGIMVHGFPNMMMLMGPHTALGNIPRSIEYSVDWVTGPDPLRDGQRTDAAGGDAGGRGILDRPRQGARRRAAVQRGRFLDDRHQLQRRGQADPHRRPLQRQRAGLSRALRRGRGEGV